MSFAVGISTASLFLRRLNEEALALFSAWGVPCAEVFLTSFSEYEPAFAEVLAREKGTAIVIVTHDRSLAARCDRTVTLLSGRIHE